jgi:guanylate kinase
MIIVLSGPGGVGKGTVVARLVAEDDGVVLSRSWTTRPRRPGESASAYHFVDRPTFEARRAAGGFLEWNEFLGNLYGTPVPELDPDRDLVLEIDVNGARQVLRTHPDALLLFVDAPDRAEQRRRLEERGDPPEAVAQRLAEGERERELAQDLGFRVVVNDDLARCVAELRAIIGAHRGPASDAPGPKAAADWAEGRG